MLALALTLVVAASPRGFPAAHSVELITQVDKRLSKWLTLEGDRKALLANQAELKSYMLSLGAEPANVAAMVTEAVNEQTQKPELQQFTATRALLAYADHATTLNFFDASGNRCGVLLLPVGTEAAPRYVLLDGPRTDSSTIEAVLEKGREDKSMLVFLEKKDGAWFTGTLPQPLPPDCTTVLKKALKTIFVAQKSYFAEHDAYSNSLSKVGVEVKSLGITSAKVSVAGAAPAQTLIIQVGLEGGVMRMDEKGETTVVSPCAR